MNAQSSWKVGALLNGGRVKLPATTWAVTTKAATISNMMSWYQGHKRPPHFTLSQFYTHLNFNVYDFKRERATHDIPHGQELCKPLIRSISVLTNRSEGSDDVLSPAHIVWSDASHRLKDVGIVALARPSDVAGITLCYGRRKGEPAVVRNASPAMQTGERGLWFW